MNLKRYLPTKIEVNNVDSMLNDRITEFTGSVAKRKIEQTARPKNFKSKIEVLIPCYNQGRFLEDAVNSLANQTSAVGICLTIINDASNDDTSVYMQRVKLKYSNSNMNIKLIDNEKNLLQGGSLNKAINSSENELFVVLNSDDILTQDCLSLIIETYSHNEEIFLLGGSSLWFESGKELPFHRLKEIKKLNLSMFGPTDALKFTNSNSINMTHSSSSFFKSAWQLVGGYLPLEKRVCIHDDRDFQMRVCSLLPIGIYERYPMAYYRTDSSLGRGII